MGCLGLVVLLVAFVGAILLLVFGSMKSSDVYKQAVAKARSNPAVVKKLGEPIQEGWFVSGSINVSPGRGEAKLTIPISGPKGKGTIYADATKRGGDWQFSALEVTVEGEERKIDLLGKPPAPMEQ